MFKIFDTPDDQHPHLPLDPDQETLTREPQPRRKRVIGESDLPALLRRYGC